MTRHALADLVRSTALGVLGDRGLDPAGVPAAVALDAPADPGRGEYATGVALRAAGPAGTSPVELAGWLAEALTGAGGVAEAAVSGPGFVALWLTDDARAEVVRTALGAGPAFPGVPRTPVTGPDARPRLVAEVLTRLGADPTGVRVGPATAGPGVEPDSLRFALLATRAGDPVRVDPAVWGPRLPPNPAFRVRHAHARAACLLRGAADLGLPIPGPDTPAAGLVPPADTLGLVRALADHRCALVEAARLREPHRVAHAAAELAEATHVLADGGRILPRGDADAHPTSAARLALCAAARRVLAEGLAVLGTDAPERI
ncbi:hypothetical protein L6E12_06825 [Actinokineospora sp. PR83]|uniref:DALR anticodon-binding domain-containing protein n=1 Tax=Actinokineospora sp. PR83 TaxID=2884908 RepID=UPI0027E076EF|nr:DALR anticodon-binding domain-containing protein [Actinokineospora sp. PR83]MCG8915499.1 hypothetical protein [Actinokineospora sp. PR83]